MIKNGITIIKKRGICYQLKGERIINFTPWLGDVFSFMYDSIMEKSIFPKKFAADINKHFELLKNQLSGCHNCSVLELACGSGNLSGLLPEDNSYTGIDISPGLIKSALKKFSKKDFRSYEFFISDASELPFKESSFDICICNLSFNFFTDTDKVIKEINRILRKEGIFYGSVPVPEKKPEGSVIRGNLLSEDEFKKVFRDNGFNFKSIPGSENGALLYFKAFKI